MRHWREFIQPIILNCILFLKLYHAFKGFSPLLLGKNSLEKIRVPETFAANIPKFIRILPAITAKAFNNNEYIGKNILASGYIIYMNLREELMLLQFYSSSFSTLFILKLIISDDEI